MRSLVQQPSQTGDGRVVAPLGLEGFASGEATEAAARAYVRDCEAELVRAEGVVFGHCLVHPHWRAVRDGGEAPACPFCQAAREAATDLNEYVRRVFSA